jgi:hypothetical protein
MPLADLLVISMEYGHPVGHLRHLTGCLDHLTWYGRCSGTRGYHRLAPGGR